MKLKFAFLCVDCTEVNDLAPRGECNRCGSQSVISLSRALSADPAAFLPKARMKRTHQGQSPALAIVPGDPQTTPGFEHALRNAGPLEMATGSNRESGLVVT